MFTDDEEMADPQKDMKIKLLDDLIEKIMSMEDEPEEADVEVPAMEGLEGGLGLEKPQGEDSDMKAKLAQLKGI